MGKRGAEEGAGASSFKTRDHLALIPGFAQNNFTWHMGGRKMV